MGEGADYLYTGETDQEPELLCAFPQDDGRGFFPQHDIDSGKITFPTCKLDNLCIGWQEVQERAKHFVGYFPPPECFDFLIGYILYSVMNKI